MRLRSLLWLTLVLWFPLAVWSGITVEATIQGTWIHATAELSGKMFPDEVRKTIKLEVKNATYTVTIGKETDQGTVKLNPAAQPKEPDIIGTDGPNKGKTILAI